VQCVGRISFPLDEARRIAANIAKLPELWSTRRRPGLSKNKPPALLCATRSLHTKVKRTATILCSAFTANDAGHQQRGPIGEHDVG
jgi:hypothetical protein